MLSNILVPLDGSAFAERTLPIAEWLARAGSGHLILIRAVQVSAFPGVDVRDAQVAAVAEARAYLDGISGHLASGGLTVESGTPYGDAATEIIDGIRLRNADLVVMATHGRSGLGRWLYGSVADEVLHRSPVPVVMVSAASAQSPSREKVATILVPLDGSDLAETSLTSANELANRLGASVVLLNVVALPSLGLYGEAGGYITFDPDKELVEAQRYLAAVAERSRPTFTHVRVRAEIGNPVECIVQVAADERAELIVMATHGRTGLARAVLGSVATGVLGRAPIPLMLVRPALVGAPAEPASSDPAAPEPSSHEEPVAEIALSRSDLDLLQRGLGELLYKPGGDADYSPQVRALATRLRRIDSAVTAEAVGPKG